MRVLHTIASLDPRHGGPSRSVPALVAALRGAGVDARAYAWDGGEAAMADARPDLVHDHGIWLPTNHRSARLARRLAIPFVVSVRGMLVPGARAHRGWKKAAAWWLYQRRDLAAAAAIHVTSEAEGAAVRAAGLQNPLIVIPNGVESPRALPPRPGGGRRVLFLSRLHPIKGVPLLIEAWARLRPTGWELAIAGPDDGGHRADLNVRVREAGLGAVVRFLGPVTDETKWALYRSAELFVLPTQSESFGLVVPEALAAELPVITTTAAPWRELSTHRCGWWVEPSVDAICGALDDALSLTDEERHAMGRRGRELILGRYAWPAIARDMAEVYTWLLDGGPRPALVQS